MAQYVAVPAQDLEQFLQAKGFGRTVQRNEVVYVRASKRDPNVLLKIYTSIHDGNSVVRAAGRDAIRVCTVWDNQHGKSFGIGKFPPIMRVYSVQSVLNRLLERIQQAAKRGNEWLDQNGAQIYKPSQQADEPGQAQEMGLDEWQERLQDKAEYAEQEQIEEEAGFASDPDYREAMVEENIRQGKCPDGCCG